MKIKGLKGSKYIFLLAFMIFSFNFITATSIYDDCNIYGNCEEVDIGNTLGDLSCSAGQIPKYNISLGGWYCASDEIGEAGTGDITAVYTGSNLTGGGTTGDVTVSLDTNALLDWLDLIYARIGDLFSGSWNDLTDVPEGFADNVDNDTQLTEAQVDAYADNNNYLDLDTYPNADTDSTDDFNGEWSNLTGVPSGFSDNIDNDTTYSHLSNFTDDILWTTEFNNTGDGRWGGGGSNYAPTSINLTTDTYNGNLSAGGLIGYEAGDHICNSNFTGSHFCTEFEVALYQGDDINNEDAWVIAGGPKYVPASIPVNDCKGWTWGTAGTYLGNYFHFSTDGKGDARALNCGSTFKLACCSY